MTIFRSKGVVGTEVDVNEYVVVCKKCTSRVDTKMEE